MLPVVHPSGKCAVYHRSCNPVVLYAATDQLCNNRKKVFRGHNSAGYAIDADISPDRQFLTSGVSRRWLCIWNQKSCKLYHNFQASDGPVVLAQWHLHETNKVGSAGLDCVIKYSDYT